MLMHAYYAYLFLLFTNPFQVSVAFFQIEGCSQMTFRDSVPRLFKWRELFNIIFGVLIVILLLLVIFVHQGFTFCLIHANIIFKPKLINL